MDKQAANAHDLEELRRRRHRQAAALIRKWADEDPAYDEKVWNLLEQELARDPMRLRDDEKIGT